MAKRISIINFKGGVGKTTLAFHLATGLARFHGAKVLLVDVDHQSSLSDLCLGDEGWRSAVVEGRSVAEIFEWLVGNRARRPSDEIIIRGPLTSYPRLDIIPSSLRLDDLEIQLTTSREIRLVTGEMGSDDTADWDKRTSICRWIEGTRRTRVDDEYDYVIFDCPPATKIVSQNAIAASHGYIIPVIPEAVMQRGLPHLVGIPPYVGVINLIDDEIYRESRRVPERPSRGRNVWVRNTQFIGLAVTWVRGGGGKDEIEDHRDHLDGLERQWKDDLIEPYIPHTTLVSKALAKNIPVYDLPGSGIETWKVRGREIHEHYRDLVTSTKQRIDRNL